MLKNLLVLLSICNLASSKSYFYGQGMTISKELKDKKLTDVNLKDLMKHNLGISGLEDQQSLELIESINKRTVVDYLFIVDTQIEIPETGVQINMDICQRECIIDQIFNPDDRKSIVNQMENKHAYLYSTDVIGSYLKNQIFLEDKSNLQFNGFQNTWKFKLNKNLNQCINEIFGSQININKNVVNFDGDMAIFDQELLDKYLFDLCAVYKLSSLITNESQNLVTFYISSLSKIQSTPLMSKIAQKMWRVTFVKFQQNLMQTFQASQIQGKLIFNQESKGFKNIMPRMLQTSGQQSHDISNENAHYLIQVWFSVIMFFALWFVLSAVFNMDIGRDTLLYAKFLTVDAK